MNSRQRNPNDDPPQVAHSDTDPLAHDFENLESDFDETIEPGSQRPNKTEGKRQTKALRALCIQLAAMPESKLSTLGLTERANDAIAAYQRIKPSAHGAIRRQLQLLIKVMREEDTDAITLALDSERNALRANSLHTQQTLEWRDKILDSDDELERFISERQLDNEFRTLARKARRERNAGSKTQTQRTLLIHLQKIFSTNTEN